MSAKGRGSAVIPNEVYQTRPEDVEKLCDEFGVFVYNHVRFREPCVADGTILEVFKRRMGISPQQWDTFEIREGRDYLDTNLNRGEVDVVVTNPPFSMAQEFVDLSLSEAPVVCYLLRLNFFGSQQRKEWWQDKMPSHLFVLADRPSFVDTCNTKGCGAKFDWKHNITRCPLCCGSVSPGTDATEYAWFVWDRYGMMRRPPGVYVI